MSVQIHLCENPFPPLLEEMFALYFNYTGPLHQIHSLLDTPILTQEDKDYHHQLHEFKKDRDSIFVKRFHDYFDKYTRFQDTYHQFIHEYIKPLFPEENQIVIQKTPNIRFSLPRNTAIGYDPNDPQDMIGVHRDRDFGHHPTEQNFIIPITQMFSTNSIFYDPNPTPELRTPPIQFVPLTLDTTEFAKAYFNGIRHCNQINQTEQTRISFDIRIIPLSQYQQHLHEFNGTKFELGKYYVVI
jgi:hypothetical protein